jgi:hypothetical protein
MTEHDEAERKLLVTMRNADEAPKAQHTIPAAIVLPTAFFLFIVLSDAMEPRR